MSARDGRAHSSSRKYSVYAHKNVRANAGLHVYEKAVEEVQGLLSFSLEGSYTKADLAALLVEAASREVSITQASRDLPSQMAESNARYHLGKLRADELLSSADDLLLRYALESLGKKPLFLAADYTEIPYYGERDVPGLCIRGGKRKQGTDYFHTYASLYVMHHGRRFTLRVRPVVKGDAPEKVLEWLLAPLLEQGIAVRCLFLDRGFYTVRVVRMLQSIGMPFCMPAKTGGKGGGLRRLKRGGSRRIRYVMHSVRYENGLVVVEEAECTMFIVRCDKCDSKGRKVHYLTFVGWRCPFGLGRIKDAYRRRFGIESSYRQMNDVRVRTSTRDPVRRLLFVLLAFLLVNLWIYLRWCVRGPRGCVPAIRELTATLESLLILLSTVLGCRYGRAREFLYLEQGGAVC